MSYQFIKKLVDILVEREGIVKSTRLYTSDFQKFVEAAKRILEPNKKLLEMVYSSTIVDVSRQFSTLQGVIKKESDILSFLDELNEELDESETTLLIRLFERFSGFYNSILSYIFGREFKETKFRILKSIEAGDLELAEYLTRRRFFNEEQKSALNELVGLIKNRNISGLIELLTKEKIAKVFSPEEIEFLKKVASKEKRRLNVLIIPNDLGFGAASMGLALITSCHAVKYCVKKIGVLASEDMCSVIKHTSFTTLEGEHTPILLYQLNNSGIVERFAYGEGEEYFTNLGGAMQNFFADFKKTIDDFKPDVIVGSTQYLGTLLGKIFGIPTVQIDTFFPELTSDYDAIEMAESIFNNQVSKSISEPTKENIENALVTVMKYPNLHIMEWLADVVADFLVVPEIYRINVTKSVLAYRKKNPTIKIGPLMNLRLKEILMNIGEVREHHKKLIGKFRSKYGLPRDFTRTILVVAGGGYDRSMYEKFWLDGVNSITSLVKSVCLINRQNKTEKIGVVLAGKMGSDPNFIDWIDKSWDDEMRNTLTRIGLIKFKRTLQMYAMSDFVVANAGQNTIAEIIVMNKPFVILPPLHSEMIRNIKECEKRGVGLGINRLIQMDGNPTDILTSTIKNLLDENSEISRQMTRSQQETLGNYKDTDSIMAKILGKLAGYSDEELKDFVPKDAKFEGFDLGEEEPKKDKVVSVLMLAHEYGNGGGIGSVVQNLTDKLRDKGAEVDVLLAGSYVQKNLGTNFVYYSEEMDIRFRSIENFIKYAQYKSKKYSIIHIHSMTFSKEDITILKNTFGADAVYTCHSIVMHQRRIAAENFCRDHNITDENEINKLADNWSKTDERRIQEYCMELASKIIHFTNQGVSTLKRYYPKHDGKFVVIPNAVNIDENFSILGKIKDVRYVGKSALLFVGRLDPEKGVYPLCEAVARIVKDIPNAVLLIVGPKYDGEWGEIIEKNMKSRLKDAPSDSYEFLGVVPNQDIGKMYRLADILIAPSFNESFGIVAIEAMKYKVPVVISDVEGPKELFLKRDEMIAMPVNPNDVSTIVNAVNEILNNPSKTKQMVERAYEAVQNKWTWDVVSESTLKLYTSIVSKTEFKNGSSTEEEAPKKEYPFPDGYIAKITKDFVREGKVYTINNEVYLYSTPSFRYKGLVLKHALSDEVKELLAKEKDSLNTLMASGFDKGEYRVPSFIAYNENERILIEERVIGSVAQEIINKKSGADIIADKIAGWLSKLHSINSSTVQYAINETETYKQFSARFKDFSKKIAGESGKDTDYEKSILSRIQELLLIWRNRTFSSLKGTLHGDSSSIHFFLSENNIYSIDFSIRQGIILEDLGTFISNTFNQTMYDLADFKYSCEVINYFMKAYEKRMRGIPDLSHQISFFVAKSFFDKAVVEERKYRIPLLKVVMQLMESDNFTTGLLQAKEDKKPSIEIISPKPNTKIQNGSVIDLNAKYEGPDLENTMFIWDIIQE